jgi:hypothetical protein
MVKKKTKKKRKVRYIVGGLFVLIGLFIILFGDTMVSQLLPPIFVEPIISQQKLVLPNGEVLDDRSYISKTFQNPDGSYTWSGSTGQIHFKNTSGDFQDTNEVFTDMGDYWEMKNASYKLFVSKNFTDPTYHNGNLILYKNKYEGADHEIYYKPHSIWWINKNNISDRQLISNAQGVIGESRGSATIYYESAFGIGLDFEVGLRSDGFIKELIIHNKSVAGSPPSPNHRPVVLFRYTGTGLTVKANDNASNWNGIDYYDSLDGFTISEVSPQFKSYIRKAYIIDSNTTLQNIQNVKVYWAKESGALYQAKVIPSGFMTNPNTTYPVRADTITAYYSSAGDGYVLGWNDQNANWDTVHDDTDAASLSYTEVSAGAVTRQWTTVYYLQRLLLPFNTSDLPDNAVITIANLSVMTTSISDQDNDAQGYVAVVGPTTQNSTDAIINTDANKVGLVDDPYKLSDDIDLTGLVARNRVYFSLNADGIANVSLTNWTPLGIREGHDIEDEAIAASSLNNFNINMSESSGTVEDPFLNVTYTITLPAVNFTYPTLANATITPNRSVEFNVSITEANLDKFIWNWNTTNFSIYDDDLVLMFNFDNLSALGENDSDAVDMSMYGHNASVRGANWSSYGRYGGAFEFDGVTGNDFINITEGVNYGNSSYTISLWFKPFKIYEPATNEIVTLISSPGTVTYWKGWVQVFMLNAANAEKINCRISNNTLNKGLASVQDTWNANTWYHLSCVYDDNADTWTMYIDGAYESNRSDVYMTHYHPDTSIVIGADTKGNSNFNGSIDEVRIWNRSLSAQEVYILYASNLQKFNTTDWYFYINQSKNATDVLEYQNYSYFAGALNDAGNWNVSQLLSIEVGATAPPADNEYPLFSNYWDDNATLVDSGTGNFNVTVVNSNGTVILEINNTNITAMNYSIIGEFVENNLSRDGFEDGNEWQNWTSSSGWENSLNGGDGNCGIGSCEQGSYCACIENSGTSAPLTWNISLDLTPYNDCILEYSTYMENNLEAGENAIVQVRNEVDSWETIYSCSNGMACEDSTWHVTSYNITNNVTNHDNFSIKVTVGDLGNNEYFGFDFVNVTCTQTSGSSDTTIFNASHVFDVGGDYPYTWHSWGNGTSENYNASESQIYTVNTTVAATCTCTDASDWEIPLNFYCNLTSNCNPLAVTFSNTGWFNCSAILNCTSFGNLAANQRVWVGNPCNITDN